MYVYVIYATIDAFLKTSSLEFLWLILHLFNLSRAPLPNRCDCRKCPVGYKRRLRQTERIVVHHVCSGGARILEQEGPAAGTRALW